MDFEIDCRQAHRDATKEHRDNRVTKDAFCLVVEHEPSRCIKAGEQAKKTHI